MKKIIAIISIALLMTACSSKLMSLKEGVSKETTVTFSSLPSPEELVTVDEETTISEELVGDKYIITAIKGEKTEVLEFPVTFEAVDIDGTLPVDLSQFYSNPDKLAKISYVFNEDETMMTITDENGEEPHSFDVPVNVIYPSYTIADDITIDTYTGYDINDFVTADEGVEVTSELNENILTITLSKGIWVETLEKEVTLEDSSPMTIHKLAKTHGYPIVYKSNILQLTLTFNDSSSVTVYQTENKGYVNGTVTYDENSIAWGPNCGAWDIKGGFGKNYYSLSEDGSIMHYDNGLSPNSSPYMFDFYLQ